MKTTLSILCVALAVVLLGTVAVAQDVYTLNYYSNANTAGAPDATVRTDNPGLTYATNCGNWYIFTSDQQMAECCGCYDTPNGLRTFSVNKDFTSNPLTGVPPITGVIKMVVGPPNGPLGTCDPTQNITPTPNQRWWATHIQNAVAGAFPITETASLDSPLSAAELTALESQCFFIGLLGSGHGVCTCGTGESKKK
jgi:hypothetical protein